MGKKALQIMQRLKSQPDESQPLKGKTNLMRVSCREGVNTNIPKG